MKHLADGYTADNPRFPEISVRLSGVDGNAFAVMGAVGKALRRAKVPAPVIEMFYEEAKAGDYDHLLATCVKWVSVS
jgi:hypothetical protein